MKLVELPDTVHGRLMESVHISGYSFERACSELDWLLDEDRWRTVGEGFSNINDFLATIDFSGFRVAIEQRKKLNKRLKKLGASSRKAAKMLGVDPETVRRDVDAANAADSVKKVKEIKASEDVSAANAAPPPAWFQDAEVNPADLAQKETKKAEKTAKREAAREEYAARKESGGRVDELQSLVAEGKRFSVIYADPPWEFKVYSGKGKERSAERHYDTMTIDVIKALPVEALAAENCALFLWAVNPELPGALDVIRAWGFDYKTLGFVWIKQNRSGEGLFTGMGYWTRANAEPCLLATRGSPLRLAMDVPQVILAPVREHSRKPDETVPRIERLLAGPYLELFAREERAGWTTWGNEIERGEFEEEAAE
jgi:N6-adenosine-specific RNA methylase IME4